ncbi:hypothetical protein OCV51_00490 [Faecalicatena acetigenes]|uniref:Uncharacterized protein n=1 Tax=Faecalicatena acetigenes TaxID=2981790 RepID=A0ABT2T7D9_9FIRM|nr:MULTISPECIES: hypothetical protein [Lachnospiraceae]MCU6746150.1 hypothetical protein [Faecalicatena acetigenes]
MKGEREHEMEEELEDLYAGKNVLYAENKQTADVYKELLGRSVPNLKCRRLSWGGKKKENVGE